MAQTTFQLDWRLAYDEEGAAHDGLSGAGGCQRSTVGNEGSAVAGIPREEEHSVKEIVNR